MLTAITGTYKNGQIILEHLPKITKQTKVLVIFEEEKVPPKELKKRQFGTLKGTIKIAKDFDEPLEELNDYM